MEQAIQILKAALGKVGGDDIAQVSLDVTRRCNCEVLACYSGFTKFSTVIGQEDLESLVSKLNGGRDSKRWEAAQLREKADQLEREAAEMDAKTEAKS